MADEPPAEFGPKIFWPYYRVLSHSKIVGVR